MRTLIWRNWIAEALFVVLFVMLVLWLTAPEENLLPAVYSVM